MFPTAYQCDLEDVEMIEQNWLRLVYLDYINKLYGRVL